jgi:hypothetical protein|tara:strand:- start:1829 stop:2146 length:318 start_codon:yes stop_codon:yes gene_type:complete
MAVTIDPRPTYFGDRMIVTGSYEAGDTTIELGGLLASIDGVIVNPSAVQTAKHQDVDVANGTSYAAVTASNIDTAIFSDTTITIAPVFTGETTTAGTFVAIGRRS